MYIVPQRKCWLKFALQKGIIRDSLRIRPATLMGRSIDEFIAHEIFEVQESFPNADHDGEKTFAIVLIFADVRYFIMNTADNLPEL